jgi:hypothetical protein
VSETFDVVVVGFGYAGGVAAIAAHDAGARVLLIDKQGEPGGISVTSAGGVRCSGHPTEALAYLLATNGGTTPAAVLRALADGMAEMEAFVCGLAAQVGATAAMRPAEIIRLRAPTVSGSSTWTRCRALSRHAICRMCVARPRVQGCSRSCSRMCGCATSRCARAWRRSG